MKIYIVMGTAGEYSDRREWVVKAFTDEEKAKVLVINATAAAKEIQKKIEEHEYLNWYDKEIHGSNKFDENCEFDYWKETNYFLSECELEQ